MYGIIKRLFVSYGLNFAPKLYEVIRSKGYNTQYFRRDAVAGLTLAIISIPLGMAFAIASGVSPAQGLYTAVVAGFFIALLGGLSNRRSDRRFCGHYFQYVAAVWLCRPDHDHADCRNRYDCRRLSPTRHVY